MLLLGHLPLQGGRRVNHPVHVLHLLARNDEAVGGLPGSLGQLDNGRNVVERGGLNARRRGRGVRSHKRQNTKLRRKNRNPARPFAYGWRIPCVGGPIASFFLVASPHEICLLSCCLLPCRWPPPAQTTQAELLRRGELTGARPSASQPAQARSRHRAAPPLPTPCSSTCCKPT